MKVQDIRKKYPKRDAFSTISPLNYVLKISGISCIYREGDKLRYRFSIFKFIIFFLLFFIANGYCFYGMFQHHESNKVFTFEDTIQIPYMLGYVQYISDIIFVYKYGRQSYIDYFIAYDHIDSILGLAFYKKSRKCITRISFIFVCLGIVVLFIDFSSWIVDLNWALWMNAYFIEFIYIVLRMLTALDIISHIILVKYRLETMSDLLKNFYCHSDNLPGVIREEAWISSQDFRKSDCMVSLKTISNSHANNIMGLCRSYILLNEQCYFINMKYGFRIFLMCILYLLEMVVMINVIVRVFVGTMILPRDSMYLAIISTTAKIFSDSSILFCGVYYCEQNYRESERIIRIIDHIIHKKNITKEIQDTLKEFKSLIVSRPINYHALNFYRLDYGTIVSITSVIVTYTIILLQNL